jgi:hypothetical protein
VLVESHRTKSGPRQRIIAYLGSAREDSLQNPIARRNFFHQLLNKIDRLTATPAIKAQIKMALVNRFTRRK